jgi:hypothetical protein
MLTIFDDESVGNLNRVIALINDDLGADTMAEVDIQTEQGQALLLITLIVSLWGSLPVVIRVVCHEDYLLSKKAWVALAVGMGWKKG